MIDKKDAESLLVLLTVPDENLVDAVADVKRLLNDVIKEWGVDVEDETPAADYDWQDDTDDIGWLGYGERMAMQSKAEM